MRWKIAVSLGLLVAAAPGAWAQSAACPGPEPESPGIGGIEIDNGKLMASVLWPAETSPRLEASLEVLDRAGTTVASQIVTPVADEVVAYTLTTDPDFFEDHGYWYTLRLAEAGGKPLAPEAPVLVSFCPPSAGCLYQVVSGAGSDGLAMTGELFELLEELAAGGSQDLLGDALALRPDLEFQIYWLADQHLRLAASKPGSGCVCRWQAEFELSPEEQVISYDLGPTPPEQENPDWVLFSSLGAGANHLGVGQMLAGGQQSLPATSFGKVGLHLRCTAVTAWTAVAWGRLSLSVPTLAPCSSACKGASVTVSAAAQSRTAGNAWATLAHGAFSSTSSEVNLFLDQQPQPSLTAQAATTVDREPGDLEETMLSSDSGLKDGEWLFPGGDATAALLSQRELEICLQAFGGASKCHGEFPRPAGDSGPWAYGCAGSESTATLFGEAACAEEPEAEATLQSAPPYSLNGLLIVPWKP